MNFADVQEFFYLFFREALFIAVGICLVAGLLLAVLTLVRTIDES